MADISERDLAHARRQQKQSSFREADPVCFAAEAERQHIIVQDTNIHPSCGLLAIFPYSFFLN